MGTENNPEMYKLTQLDNKFVDALVEMWKSRSQNYLMFEKIELEIELEKPIEERDWRKITILETAFSKLILN